MLSDKPPIVSIAPMLDYTDRHFRYLMRLISPYVLLYTEMVTTGAILNNSDLRYLQYHPNEHPVAVQLGGSDPIFLAQCARICEDLGYDEINLNIGCPSDRVQSGSFGACLMAEPELVAECVAAMQAEVMIPITVKTRIGIDKSDDMGFLYNFINTVKQTGCQTFIIHARKAWLKGLNPKQNRNIPPLQYDVVYQLKQDNPELNIIINGGVKSITDVELHLKHVDGVMIGRKAYDNPMSILDLMQHLNPNHSHITREQILEKYNIYMQNQIDQGVAYKRMSRHLMNLYHGLPGAKAWRRKVAMSDLALS